MYTSPGQAPGKTEAEVIIRFAGIQCYDQIIIKWSARLVSLVVTLTDRMLMGFAVRSMSASQAIFQAVHPSGRLLT